MYTDSTKGKPTRITMLKEHLSLNAASLMIEPKGHHQLLAENGVFWVSDKQIVSLVYTNSF